MIEKPFEEKVEHLPLLATHVNLKEIIHSKNLLKGEGTYLLTILKGMYAHKLSPQNPFHYVYNIEKNLSGHGYDGFEFTVQKTCEDLIKGRLVFSEFIENWKIKIEENDALKIRAKEMFNEHLDEFRANRAHKNIYKKNKNVSEDILNARSFFETVVKDYALLWGENNFSIQNETTWQKIDFFIRVLSSFNTQIEISNQKFDKNDVDDLLNMVYVLPGYLYWTEEKQWKTIINSNVEAKKQLYIPI